MKSNKHIICCFAALSLLVAGCSKTKPAADLEKQVQEFSKTEQGSYIERTETTIEAVRGGVLHLVTKQGDVEVDSWRRDEVRVVVEKRSDVSDEAQALALFEAFQVTTTPASDTVQVRAGAREGDSLASVTVRLVVRVPSQFGVYIETAKGGIVISDLGGDVEARTEWGGVTLNSVKGDVMAETGAGGITMDYVIRYVHPCEQSDTGAQAPARGLCAFFLQRRGRSRKAAPIGTWGFLPNPPKRCIPRNDPITP